MRAIFCGNLEFDARQSELERLFKRYGTVERVDIKSGFAFVYMEDERDAEVAVRKLDQVEFGRKGRRLRVEWTKQERDARRSGGGGSKLATNQKPSRTLFVINFDPIDTRSKDLERHFEPHGKVVNIRIRKNFAFIQFETQEEATKALEATNMSELLERVITVEYATRDDDANSAPSFDRRGGRDREMSSERGGFNRRRSPSPYRKERGSPDYGRGRDRGSPKYGRARVRDSPDYGRGRDRGSPDYGGVRGRNRGSPDYVRGRDQGSPNGPGRVRGSPNGPSRVRGSPDGPGRVRGSPSGPGRDGGSPDGAGSGRDQRSPNGRGRDRGSPYGGDSPKNGRGISKHEVRGSPYNGRDESPANGRYHRGSSSPPPRERSRS